MLPDNRITISLDSHSPGESATARSQALNTASTYGRPSIPRYRGYCHIGDEGPTSTVANAGQLPPHGDSVVKAQANRTFGKLPDATGWQPVLPNAPPLAIGNYKI